MRYLWIFFKNNILTFSETIWEDKSSWGNIVLFEFDINNSESRTIRSAEVDYDSDNIANAVLWEDWESESVQSISDFGRIEEWFSSWISLDLLNERKNSIKELSIEPMTGQFFYLQFMRYCKHILKCEAILCHIIHL